MNGRSRPQIRVRVLAWDDHVMPSGTWSMHGEILEVLLSSALTQCVVAKESLFDEQGLFRVSGMIVEG